MIVAFSMDALSSVAGNADNQRGTLDAVGRGIHPITARAGRHIEELKWDRMTAVSSSWPTVHRGDQVREEALLGGLEGRSWGGLRRCMERAALAGDVGGLQGDVEAVVDDLKPRA